MQRFKCFFRALLIQWSRRMRLDPWSAYKAESALLWRGDTSYEASSMRRWAAPRVIKRRRRSRFSLQASRELCLRRNKQA